MAASRTAEACPNDAGVYDDLQALDLTDRQIQKASSDLEAHGYLEPGSTSSYRPILEHHAFQRYGLAPQYLRIAGRWQDHEL